MTATLRSLIARIDRLPFLQSREEKNPGDGDDLDGGKSEVGTSYDGVGENRGAYDGQNPDGSQENERKTHELELLLNGGVVRIAQSMVNVVASDSTVVTLQPQEISRPSLLYNDDDSSVRPTLVFNVLGKMVKSTELTAINHIATAAPSPCHDTVDPDRVWPLFTNIMKYGQNTVPNPIPEEASSSCAINLMTMNFEGSECILTINLQKTSSDQNLFTFTFRLPVDAAWRGNSAADPREGEGY